VCVKCHAVEVSAYEAFHASNQNSTAEPNWMRRMRPMTPTMRISSAFVSPLF